MANIQLGNEKNIPNKPITIYRQKNNIDFVFAIIVIILLCLGSVMVFSSSYMFAESKYGNNMFFIKKQIIYAAIGLVAMFGISLLDYSFIKKFTWPIFGLSCFLLLLVLVIGKNFSGGTRWIQIGGLTIQPSEIMKFALPLMLASYYSKNQSKIKSTKEGIIYPGIIVMGVCVLTILEKHLSGTIILFFIGLVIIFSSSANAKWLLGVVGGFGGIAVAFIAIAGYAKDRIDAWLHPELHKLDGSWQPYESLLAIGSGGFFGVGLGNSTIKNLWLPEPQNDFIFAIVCEELGFVGASFIILLFVVLVWRGLKIAFEAPDTFSTLLVVGLISKILIQVLLNIAVVTVSIPTTGIALPFFSYGGTALVVQMAEIGVILSISKYKKASKLEEGKI